MTAQHRILLLDDDPDCVEMYGEILASLPSKPEILTATSGARAIALLEAQPFTLLISDLNMPRMDGLQVLMLVRRKFPQLRTAVLTSVADEQFRARGYAMGIDLFLEKPSGSHEIRFMLDCIESLLGRDDIAGFRGVQNKSLVDIVQLECLSQSSSVLRITQGIAEGRIWIQKGEVIDAVANELSGENAFKKILSWKTGNFEILPDEPARTRSIFTSYQGLLLETAQALDESEGNTAGQTDGLSNAQIANASAEEIGHFHGVEFVMQVDVRAQRSQQSWGAENPDQIAEWTRSAVARFRAIGEVLNAGSFTRAEASGPLRHVSVVGRSDNSLCVGFNRSLSQDRVRETMKKIIAQWAS
ncbi:MAG: response regulator [Verrucomicrobiales bacterium]|nr:response regulator [Verrucomicrobiales bacterium]